jgi:hypothetical protein
MAHFRASLRTYFAAGRKSDRSLPMEEGGRRATLHAPARNATRSPLRATTARQRRKGAGEAAPG